MMMMMIVIPLASKTIFACCTIAYAYTTHKQHSNTNPAGSEQ